MKVVGSVNIFEKVLYLLQGEMERPESYGWFHLLWIGITLFLIIYLSLRKTKNKEKELKTVLLVYGIGAFILELTKQIIWSFNYDPTLNIVSWDYQWYAAPFQLCTTPIFVTLICAFLKDGKVRNSLLSYLAFFTILGSIMTIIIPDSCFVRTIEINIHTMYLHCLSFVVSMYLLIKGHVKIDIENVIKGFYVFLIFVGIALFLDIFIYNIGILNGETFNMFYISPYFISSLPIYDVVQQNVPYLLFLIIYIVSILLGGLIVYGISLLIKKIVLRKKI